MKYQGTCRACRKAVVTMNAREFLAELKQLQSYLSHGPIYEQVGEKTFYALAAVLTGAVNTFETILALHEDKDTKQ